MMPSPVSPSHIVSTSSPGAMRECRLHPLWERALVTLFLATLALPGADRHAKLCCQAWLLSGHMLSYRGLDAEAIAMYEKSIALARSGGFAQLLSRALSRMGYACLNTHDRKAARIYLEEAFVVSAQLASAVRHSNIAANALAEPAMPLLLGLAFTTAALDVVSPSAAAVVAWLNGWVAAYIALCASAIGSLPFARITSYQGLAALLGSLLLATYAWRRWRTS